MVFDEKTMKKILTILSLLFAFQSMAQGNLQFNQVINIKNGDTYTVPAGKVLKITSVTSSSKSSFKIPFSNCDSYGQCFYRASDFTMFQISNSIYSISQNIAPVLSGISSGSGCNCPPNINYDTNLMYSVPTPIWLKNGEIVSINPGNGILISAIEFNIVP
jgi:hypothetical protein